VKALRNRPAKFEALVTVPKVTVVTVNYNMGEDLAVTMASVLAQSYSSLEYIVIDGGSSDGSLALLRAHQSRIAHWVSEPDRGLYDAMNKGVEAATGEWILFMNAGDWFHDPAVVADIFAGDTKDADVIYGDMVRRYGKENVERLVPARPLSALPMRMPCSHQSIFARRELLLRFPFSQEFSLAADHDFILQAMRSGARFRKQARVIGIFSTGGASDRNRLEAMRQLSRILKRHGLLTPCRRLRHSIMLARALAGTRFKQALPRPLTRWILQRRPLG
jgi:glycosyltransferase involved in cell wall biosynthesis